MSLSMVATRWMLRLAAREFADTERWCQRVLARTSAEAAPVQPRLQRRFAVTESLVAGHRVLRFAPRSGGSDWHIVYACGGAYVEPPVSFHWLMLEKLIDATGATVTVPLYPLAPEHGHAETFGLMQAVWAQVLQERPARRLVLAGDSAGGGLAVSVALQLRDAGLPLPQRLLLFAPWLDITLADPAAEAMEGRDPELVVRSLRRCGAWWAGNADPRHPYLSPLYADLAGLPPIEIHQGSEDVLAPDVHSFVARVRAAGGQVDCTECAGGFHVFNGAVWTPESKAMYRQLAASFGGAAR